MKIQKNSWFIAFTPDTDIVHYGFVQKGTNLDSGQPFVEYFDIEELYITRLEELGVVFEQDDNTIELEV